MFNLQLSNIRKANGYTQQSLANALGTTRRIVGAWERGEFEFPFDEAFRVCELLGCTFEELAGEKPYTPPAPKIEYSLVNLDALDGDELTQVQQFVDFVISKKGQ